MNEDKIQAVVERYHKPPAGWAWFRSELLGDGPGYAFLITGGIPRIVSRGPKKGSRTWRGVATNSYVITREQMDSVQ